MESGSGTRTENGGNGRYRFGCVLVDSAAHTLSRDGEEQPVEPKAFAVLLHLLAHRGELVTRDQLLDAVWGHRHVTPGVLTRAVAQLRSAMDDDSHHPRYIQTQHALGYRFIGETDNEDDPRTEHAPGEPASAATPVLPPAKRERRSDDRLAHRRWLISALLLAVLLAALAGAALILPVP